MWAPRYYTSTMRVAVYTRISKDSAGLGAGVARQEADCRAKADANGWTIVRVFTDNDVSAYSGTPRPGYVALLEAIKAREVDAVVVWHTDRLYRRTTDLEEYIKVCEPLKVPTYSVQSGPLDLATPSGQMVARVLGSVAQYESQQKAARQRRANRQRAEQGRHFGTRRPFGFELDGVTIRQDEAEAVRKAFHDVLAGVSLHAIAKEWNARGFRTPQAGNEWDSTVLGRTLRTHRLAGLKTYRGEIVRDAEGNPIKPEWPALVDLETFEAAQALMNAPGRSWPSASRQLLSGLAVCSECGAPIMSGGTRAGERRYRCGVKGGHMYRAAPPIDDYVIALAVERLSRPDATRALLHSSEGIDVDALRTEAAAIHKRRDALAEGYADGAFTLSQFKAANAKLAERLEAIEAAMPKTASGALAAVVTARDPRDAFEALGDDGKREVLGALFERIELTPARTKERAYLTFCGDCGEVVSYYGARLADGPRHACGGDNLERMPNPETVPVKWREVAPPPAPAVKRKRTVKR